MSLPLLHHLSTESEGHLSVSHRVQSLVLPPQSSGHPHEGALNVGVVLGRRLNGVQHVFGGCVSLGLIEGDLPQTRLAGDRVLLSSNE